MASKAIEKVLNSSYDIKSYNVDYNVEDDMYTIDMNVGSPRDNQDWNNLMKIKNKVRSVVHRSYRLDFIIRFTT